MIAAIASLLGIDAASIPDDAQARFIFTHAPRSWMVFIWLALAAAGLLAVFVMYRRERGASVRLRRRWMLAAVRSAVLLVLVGVLMGPALAVAHQRLIEPYVLVLVDDSLSMSIRDRYADAEAARHVAEVLGVEAADVIASAGGGPTRAQIVDAMLTRHDGKLLDDLRADARLRVMSFARELQLRQTLPSMRGGNPTPAEPSDSTLPTAPKLPPLVPAGPSTNLAHGLQEAMRSISSAPIAAIVLITDGQNTEGDDPRAAADQAAALSIPLLVVGVGQAEEPRNLRVAELWAPDSTFRDDPFLVQAQIDAEGMDARSVNVELLARSLRDDGSAGEPRVLQRQALSLPAGQSSQRISFEHRPQEAGRYVLSVRVEPVAGEVVETDNVRSAPLQVLSDKARVLLVAGSPSWEYRMLSTLLVRDGTIDVSCWLQTLDPRVPQTGDTVIDEFPRTAEQLMDYDVIVLMDPDPAVLDEAWIEAMKRFLDERAGGLMWVAGPRFTGRCFTQEPARQILSVVPVQVSQLSALDVETLVMTHTQPWPPRVTPEGADHVLLRLDADPQINRQMWQRMPGLYWSFPARAAKPGALTLIEHSDPRLTAEGGSRPLLVAGQYGPGRTLYMGFSGTWRWRKLGEKYFDQFWIQAIRYLVEGRLLGESRRGRLNTDRDVYVIGSRARIEAMLYDSSFNPLREPRITATLSAPGTPGQSLELLPAPDQPGRYEGFAVLTQVGLNEIAVQLPRGAGVAGPRLTRQFTVELPQIEFADPRLNRALLTDLAQRTGGKYLEIDQTDELASLVPLRSQNLVVRGQPIPLWDNLWIVVLLAGLLCVEWAMRKQWKMM